MPVAFRVDVTLDAYIVGACDEHVAAFGETGFERFAEQLRDSLGRIRKRLEGRHDLVSKQLEDALARHGRSATWTVIGSGSNACSSSTTTRCTTISSSRSSTASPSAGRWTPSGTGSPSRPRRRAAAPGWPFANAGRHQRRGDCRPIPDAGCPTGCARACHPGSILLAFGIDARWELAQEQAEADALLEVLRADFVSTVAEAERVRQSHGGQEAAEALIALAEERTPTAADGPRIDRLFSIISVSGATFDPLGTVQALISRYISLIEDPELAAMLTSWPADVEDLKTQEMRLGGAQASIECALA